MSLSQLFSPAPSPTALFSYRGEWLSGQEQDRASQRTPDSAYQRWLRRSRLGVAIYEGVEDSDPSKNVPARLAVGFSTSLWDESDPLMQNGPNARAFTDECEVEVLADRAARSNPNLRSSLESLDSSPEGRRIVALSALSQELGLGTARITERFDRSTIDQRAYERTVDGLEQYFANTPVMRTAMREAIKDCAQRASEIAELRRDLDIGIGLLYRGEPGQFSEFDERGAAAWVAFRYPWGVDLINPDFGTRLVNPETGGTDSTDPLANVDSYWLVAGSARFSQDEFIATGNDVTPEIQVDQIEGWIGIERYSQRFRFGAFYGYSEVEAVEPAGEAFERSGERYVISAQYRLGDEDDSGLWVGLTYGDTGNSADENNDRLMFSINFAPQPAYEVGNAND